MKQRKLIKMATANLKAEGSNETYVKNAEYDDWRVQKLTEQLQAERERKCSLLLWCEHRLLPLGRAPVRPLDFVRTFAPSYLPILHFF